MVKTESTEGCRFGWKYLETRSQLWNQTWRELVMSILLQSLSKDRTLRPSWSWRKGYGSAAIDGFNFMVNSSIPITETTEFYAFGGHNFRNTDMLSRDSFGR
jgi:hypothetical protein